MVLKQLLTPRKSNSKLNKNCFLLLLPLLQRFKPLASFLLEEHEPFLLGLEGGRYFCVLWVYNLVIFLKYMDRLCGLVVRAPGYKSRGLGFDSWRYQIL
jgi:hypothetical protein